MPPVAEHIVVVEVPTTNFVLHWITGRSESHHFDDSLKSIELITADAYEPKLPLSLVVHIDYEKAPSVIQRFGDVKQLITQTLDPMLSAYFRDVAHKKSMLELIHRRDEIQKQAREELRNKFAQFDIQCVDVLIGRPESKPGDTKIESLLEQLRQRQFAIEQVETYQKQQEAAVRQKSLNEALAQAQLQAELTKSQVQIRISENTGDAELAKARKVAETTVVQAEAAAKQARLQGEGEAGAAAGGGRGPGQAGRLDRRRRRKEGGPHRRRRRQADRRHRPGRGPGPATEDRFLPRPATVRRGHRGRSTAAKPAAVGALATDPFRRRRRRRAGQHAGPC